MSVAGLKSGKTQSCGCLQIDRASASNTKDWTGVVSDYGIMFIRQSRRNHKNIWLWTCQCGLCGKMFDSLPAHVLSNVVTSCGCAKSSSKERLIEKILVSSFVDYRKEVSFDNCKYKHPLKFDFAIYKDECLQCLIEYDGRQHFESIDWFGGQEAFIISQKRDSIKNKFCQNNNIPLLRLPYTLTDEEIKESILNIIHP